VARCFRLESRRASRSAWWKIGNAPEVPLVQGGRLSSAAEAFLIRKFVKPMLLGRVIGNVVCTVKSDALEGKKLMLVQPLDRHLKDKGKVIVALDSVGAGTGELIYWCRGKEASFAWPEQEVPTEASIVGIVDQVHLG
jgi:ethanolamine utilization protein EutN